MDNNNSRSILCLYIYTLSRFKKGYSQSTDKIQKKLIADLRKLGWSVEVDHDDILVGTGNRTYWIELKTSSPYKKCGSLKPDDIRLEQYRILATYKGDYCIAWTLEQVINWCTNKRPPIEPLDRSAVITPDTFRKYNKRLLDPAKRKLLRLEPWWNLD